MPRLTPPTPKSVRSKRLKKRVAVAVSPMLLERGENSKSKSVQPPFLESFPQGSGGEHLKNVCEKPPGQHRNPYPFFFECNWKYLGFSGFELMKFERLQRLELSGTIPRQEPRQRPSPPSPSLNPRHSQPGRPQTRCVNNARRWCGNRSPRFLYPSILGLLAWNKGISWVQKEKHVCVCEWIRTKTQLWERELL